MCGVTESGLNSFAFKIHELLDEVRFDWFFGIFIWSSCSSIAIWRSSDESNGPCPCGYLLAILMWNKPSVDFVDALTNPSLMCRFYDDAHIQWESPASTSCSFVADRLIFLGSIQASIISFDVTHGSVPGQHGGTCFTILPSQFLVVMMLMTWHLLGLSLILTWRQ